MMLVGEQMDRIKSGTQTQPDPATLLRRSDPTVRQDPGKDFQGGIVLNLPYPITILMK